MLFLQQNFENRSLLASISSGSFPLKRAHSAEFQCFWLTASLFLAMATLLVILIFTRVSAPSLTISPIVLVSHEILPFVS